MDVSNENSWWNTNGLWQDPDLAKVRESSLRYHPTPITLEEAQTKSIFTLRGPRRAGKTVALKLLVVELIEKLGISPQKILWYNLDTVRTLAQMESNLATLLQLHQPDFIFLDEVTSVIGWQKLIKKFRDTGLLTNCSVFLTGSSAYDLKQGSERMAGRKGVLSRVDRVLLPMSFQSFKNAIPELEVTAEDYLKVGGFPFRVSEFKKNRLMSQPFDVSFGLDVFDDVFFYEINRRRLDRNIALELLFRISQLKTSSISYEAFAKALTITNDTAKKYLNILGDAFLLATFYSYDSGKHRVAPKKDKKLLWVDPAISWLAFHSKQGEAPSESFLVESAVGIELLRRYEFRIFEGLSSPRNVFTWKSKSGNEIDFLVVDRSQKLLLPVEVKYQNSISPSDFLSMERAFGSGLLVTKNQTLQRDLSLAMTLQNFLVSEFLK